MWCGVEGGSSSRGAGGTEAVGAVAPAGLLVGTPLVAAACSATCRIHPPPVCQRAGTRPADIGAPLSPPASNTMWPWSPQLVNSALLLMRALHRTQRRTPCPPDPAGLMWRGSDRHDATHPHAPAPQRRRSRRRRRSPPAAAAVTPCATACPMRPEARGPLCPCSSARSAPIRR